MKRLANAAESPLVSCAGEFELDVNCGFDFKEKVTGILDTPGYIGDFEGGGSLPLIGRKIGMDDSGNFVVAPMERKYAAKLHVRRARGRHRTFDLGRAKNGVRVLCGL